MWKPWMDAHVARMKARANKLLQLTEELTKPITNGNDKRNRREEWKKRSTEVRERQVAGLIRAHEERKKQAQERRDSLPEVELVIHTGNPNGRGRPRGQKDYEYVYPDCPRCHSSKVKRAGVDRGQQRYRCLSCNRSFGNVNRVVVKFEPYHITCCRCGGKGTYVSKSYTKNYKKEGRRSQYHGIVGYCPSCNKNFTQGGPEHLDRTMTLLLNRIDELRVDQELKIEILQQASIDVLEGYAYTWNVPFNISAAKDMMYDRTKETKKYRMNERNEEFD